MSVATDLRGVILDIASQGNEIAKLQAELARTKALLALAQHELTLALQREDVARKRLASHLKHPSLVMP